MLGKSQYAPFKSDKITVMMVSNIYALLDATMN